MFSTISILCPTRKRPDNIYTLVSSALDTATNPDGLEFVFYVDNDDDTPVGEIAGELHDRVKVVRGERIVLSEMWNQCHNAAEGPYYYHMGDDNIFRTKGWDSAFLDVFARYPDRIVLVHARDGSVQDARKFGTHCMIHENWVKAVGYFVPPYFSSDYNDTWLNDVANAISRKVMLNEHLVEHMHWSFGKHEYDDNHKERMARHAEDKVDELYIELAPKRQEDIRKLQRFIKEFSSE